MIEKDYILADTKEARSLIFLKLLSSDIPFLSFAMPIAIIIKDYEKMKAFSIILICILLLGSYLTFFIVAIIDSYSEILPPIGKIIRAKETISSDIFVHEDKIRIVNYKLISMFHVESLFYLVIYYLAYRNKSKDFKQKHMEKEEYEIDIEEIQDINIKYNFFFYDSVQLDVNSNNFYLILKDGEDFLNKVTLLEI